MNKDFKSLFGSHHGLDERSVDFLTSALAKNNLPGFDYIEFKQSLSALAAMNMKEDTAFKSAFATASTVGLTKAKLLESANHYKGILDREKSQFDVALKKQMDQRVASKMREVEKLKEQIIKHKEQIRKLEEQIQKSQITIDNADQQMEEAKNKILKTKENFEHTYQSILNQIDKDIANINSYI